MIRNWFLYPPGDNDLINPNIFNVQIVNKKTVLAGINVNNMHFNVTNIVNGKGKQQLELKFANETLTANNAGVSINYDTDYFWIINKKRILN